MQVVAAHHMKTKSNKESRTDSKCY